VTVFLQIHHNLRGNNDMQLVRNLSNSQFLRHNTIFFVGSVTVGALNYLYYPILGRMLTPASFGEVQTLVSLFLQLSIFLSVLSLVAVNIVANADGDEARNALVLEFEKLASVISIVLLILTIIFGTQLQHFLRFDSPLPFVLLALSIVVTVPFTLRGAFLRGKHRFGLASTSNLIASAGKILFSAALVAIGLGTAGAIGGLVLAQAVACALVAWWTFRLGLQAKEEGRRPLSIGLPNMRVLLPELRYGGIVLVASLAITMQYSIDILIVKHYFDARTAGLYAGIASAGRVIFFLTASFSQVLMPMVKIKNTDRENRQLLIKSFILFGGLSIPTLLLFSGFPKLIIGILMGHSYLAMAGLLPRLSLAIFVISILNLLASYYLALRRYGVAVVALLGALLTYGLMLANHNSVAGVVNGLLVGSAAMLGLLVVWRAGAALKGKVT
jgi:O-antigen/teichoic acid export membrane protein